MDLWQLHIFRKVVELASFSKAGESIHLSQPTVSSHIKDLEKHFGCPLIDRLSRCAVPTKAGELLYSNATRILAMRDEIENIMAEYQGQYRGGLRIGASTIPGGYLLPKIIGGFNRDYPNIQISLLIGDSKEIVQKVLAGDIEIGFVGAHYESPHLHETAFTNDELKLVVYPEHPWADKLSVEIEALCQEPMIVREAGSGSLHVLTSALKNKGLNLEKDFHIVAEIGNTVGIIGAIKNRVGVSILSTRAIENELKHGELVALDLQNFELHREIYLVVDQRRTRSPLARAFHHFISSKGKAG
jgi:DNA-binding transcriptional LysR family regulator